VRQVSIIIPCFNAASTISATVESALSQVDCDFEVLVVDDGSSDNSVAIVRSIGPVLRVISRPNRGVSIARNTGISETSSEWLLFLDADDLLIAGTLAARLETAAISGADVVICDWHNFTETEAGSLNAPVRSVNWKKMQDAPDVAVFSSCWAPSAALLYRRSLVERIGGFREDLLIWEDARLMFDAAYHGARFRHSAHLGARYRISPTSLSRRDPSQYWRYFLKYTKQIEALWRVRAVLSPKQKEALANMYDHVARGLFRLSCPEYFEAVAAQQQLGLKLPLHHRIVAPLASAIGLRSVQKLLRIVRPIRSTLGLTPTARTADSWGFPNR